jgi:hypothetical protein
MNVHSTVKICCLQVIEQLVIVAGYSPVDAGYFVLLGLASSFVGMGITARLMDKTHAYV